MIPYIGGKHKLASWIISNFPEDYKSMHYVEVFGGAGWVLFKKEKSLLETYNDLNSDLVNMFIQIRDNYKEFKRRAYWSLHSRNMFKIAQAKYKHRKFEDDVDRAVQYAIIRVQSFSGTGNSWGYRKGDKNSRWLAFLKRLTKIRKRLERVQIESLDFRKVIEKYDTENTIFYLDPPYVDREYYYDVDFGIKEHIELANLLRDIKGKFLLSYYPHSLIDELYKDFTIISKQTSKASYGITILNNSSKRPKATELLIKNF